MKTIADLHIHSRHSRACSKAINIENLEKYAGIKGVSLLGTGDFTHPEWLKEIKEKLREDENGVLWTKTGFPFIWQTEISLMYTQDNKGRKVHLVILAPDKDTVEQINSALIKLGRLDYDGRPIFGMSCTGFAELVKGISKEIEIIPAHAWTPFFGILGSKSGFDSVEECFKDQAKHIHAIETGMSSDPAMNWRLSKLDKYTLVSNSDSHSFWPWRLGREANVFELKQITYKNIIRAIRTKEGFEETIEVDPSYGKYHYDGHRNCGVCMSPNEAIKNKNICPKCGRELTIGVLHRVEELADRPEGFRPKDAVPFRALIPLSEIIAETGRTGIATQKTWKTFNGLISRFGSEFRVLLEAGEEELKKSVEEKLAQAIIKNREGKISIRPGYDGEYCRPILDENAAEQKTAPKPRHQQKGLDEY